MKKTMEEEYRLRYPSLFDDSLISFNVGNGWRGILDRLCDKLVNTKCKIVQVKEKFGGLRFYVENETTEITHMIHEAELESYKTCEYCGTTKDVTTSGSWLKTLCESCNKTKYDPKHH
jgi:hypothetical protein